MEEQGKDQDPAQRVPSPSSQLKGGDGAPRSVPEGMEVKVDVGHEKAADTDANADIEIQMIKEAPDEGDLIQHLPSGPEASNPVIIEAAGGEIAHREMVDGESGQQSTEPPMSLKPGTQFADSCHLPEQDPPVESVKETDQEQPLESLSSISHPEMLRGASLVEDSLEVSRVDKIDGQSVQLPQAVIEDHAPMQDLEPTINGGEGIETSENAEGAEWEADSSPIDSSSSASDTSSLSSSSDEDDESVDEEDGDPGYAMLNPEEQARILMQSEGGSDDEGNARGGKNGEAVQPRTANEKPEEVIPKPSINVTEDMKIEELGHVEGTVENTVLVKAKVSGEYRVLESNSLLCLEDRRVIGVVSETLGRVQQPLYTVRFTNMEAIQEAGLSEKNTPVYYVQDHSTFVFTHPMRAVKGSDASNFHDEEVGAEEMEFSDDEAEAEHKRQLKLKRQGRKDGRNERSGHHPRGRFGGPTNMAASRRGSVNGDRAVSVNYDDIPPMGDDGYNPLARPANLHEMMGAGEAPMEGGPPAPALSTRGGDRGGDRGRGRGQGRGDRGRRDGRGGFGRGTRGRNGNHQQHWSRSLQPNGHVNGHSNSPPLQAETFPSSQASTTGHQPISSLTFPLPQIPRQSQHPYAEIHPQSIPTPSPAFSYQQPTPPPAPAISPQPSSYQSFNPSPISPLPSNPFSFNSATHLPRHQHPQQPYPPAAAAPPPPPPPSATPPYQHPHQNYQPQYTLHQQQSFHHRHHQPYNNNHSNPDPNPYNPQDPMLVPPPQQQQQQQQQPPSQPQPQPPPSSTPMLPPPGSHINPAFYDMLRRQGQSQGGG